MPRRQPKNRTRRKSDVLLALLVAAGAGALARPVPLAAQELGLRGDIAEPGASVPVYEPVSPGAVPDEADRTAQTRDDGFAPMPPQDGISADTEAEEAGTAALPQTPVATSDDEATADAAEPNPRIRAAGAQEREPLDPGVDRTGSIEGAPPEPEDDPFAPVGIRVGTFVLRPSIEEGLTATTNADASPGGGSAVVSETTLRLNATSDWALNAATIDAYGTFRKSVSGEDVDEVRGRIDGTLDLDLDHDWRATARLGYEAGPESASSPVVIQNTTSRPLHQIIDGSLGIAKAVGKARLSLTGTVERDLYGDADLEGGGTLSQKDRNSTLYTAALRGGYAISPALVPFAEVEVGRRSYDERIDASGYERSADRLRIRGGTEIDLGEKFRGEVSAGWIREALDDDRLTAISGASIDADLRWSPERGTIIGLTGSTTAEGTTTVGESGSLLYSGRLTLERRIRSNLTANAALGAAWRNYSGSDGHDRILSAEAGLTWWLNRYAGITTRARYEKQTSNLPDRDYDATSVFLGLKVQR